MTDRQNHVDSPRVMPSFRSGAVRRRESKRLTWPSAVFASTLCFLSVCWAIAAIAVLDIPRNRVSSPASSDSLEIVEEFYSLVNEALAAGDTSSVQTAPMEHMIDDDGTGYWLVGPTRVIEQMDDLLSVGSKPFINSQIAATTDGKVIASTTVEWLTDPIVTGFDIISLNAGWPYVEVFGVGGGRILSREYVAAPRSVSTPVKLPFGQLEYEEKLSLSAVIATYRPGESVRNVTTTSPALLTVVEGELLVSLKGDSGRPAVLIGWNPSESPDSREVRPGTKTVIADDDVLVLWSGSTYVLENQSLADSTTVIVSGHIPMGTNPGGDPVAGLPPGANPLLGRTRSFVSSGRVRSSHLVPAFVELSPNASLRVDPRTQFLVVISHDGPVSLFRESGVSFEKIPVVGSESGKGISVAIFNPGDTTPVTLLNLGRDSATAWTIAFVS